MKIKTLFLVAVAVAAGSTSFAQQNAGTMQSGTAMMVGKESKAEFDRANKKGAAMVAAVKPTSSKLSSGDQDLMKQVAMGGMMQLEASQIAMQKASSNEVRELAKAEVDEQTGLKAKLKEIAQDKNMTLPSTPDAETTALLTKLRGASGQAFDRMFVDETGVKGHEKLDAVMTKVKASASDATLKDVAQAAHPLVKEHLKVSREIMAKMGNNGKMNGR